jgi:hypothetical protein
MTKKNLSPHIMNNNKIMMEDAEGIRRDFV